VTDDQRERPGKVSERLVEILRERKDTGDYLPPKRAMDELIRKHVERPKKHKRLRRIARAGPSFQEERKNERLASEAAGVGNAAGGRL
jgi:hypothetical protein